MARIRQIIRLKLTTYSRLWLIGLILAAVAGPVSMVAQNPDPAASIKNLHDGVLIVRFPTSSSKIDTLRAMIGRAEDKSTKERLEKLLKETISDRDTLIHDYIQAFKIQYRFSQAAYFYDYDAHDLNKAAYYNLDGERLAIGDLMEKPLFFLYFERSEESKIDALVIYDRNIKKIPRPFPNSFSRGGVNFLFLKMSDKNFPAWRIGKINRQLTRYYNEVMLDARF